MLKISDRLIQVAGLVPENVRLADVGTDHGYVPIWLLEQGRISSAIAMDVNRGPLLRARENRDKYGFQKVMELRLSDGLEKLEPGEADALLIAGMGGPLMIRILEAGWQTVKSIPTLVLQPQSEIPAVRRYLIENGFCIDDEIMLKDEGKYYMAMKVSHGYSREWSETEYLFSRYLLDQRHPVLKEFLMKEKRIYSEIEKKLTESGLASTERYSEVTEYLEALESGLTYYANR